MQGQPLVRDGKTLLSGIDPVRRAERTADAVSVKDRTLYFCPSPLYGYGLEQLLSRLKTEAPDSAVLCLEADIELFELTKKNIEPSLFADKMLQIINVNPINDFKSTFAGVYNLVRDTWGARAFRRIETIRFTGGWQLYPQFYDSLNESLRREIAADWSNALTMTKLGRLYIRNVLRNLTLVSKYRSVSEMSFGEAPVLVLGAGPSLDETLDVLSGSFADVLEDPASRSFKIVCVDTCLGVLKDRNITPDLVVILESQHWNLRDFIGCRGWNIPAAVDLSSLPASANILAGEGYLFFTPWTSLKIFERLRDVKLLPAAVPPLGSVGLTAVALARFLTSGKIICAGIDFSFTHNKYHARSTPGHRSRLGIQTRLRRILNTAVFDSSSVAAVSKSGLAVHTSPIMKNYRDTFEQEFGLDSRIFDIESTGLPLGVKTLTMNEAMDMFKNSPRNNGKKGPRIFAERRGEELEFFFNNERQRLEELRGILTGESAAADKERLSVLIEECDYLWAHFPDLAGGRKPVLEEGSSIAVSFLKRVRAEIDPMLKLVRN
ncbi:MAG: DUF115 domain-containing protein [Treponema sp.]|nr:DUF115 domain-containing protein [Treponema sp.]